MAKKPNFEVLAQHTNKKGSTKVGAAWYQQERENGGITLGLDISVVCDKLLLVVADKEEGTVGATYLSSLVREDNKPSFVVAVPKQGSSSQYTVIVGAGWVQPGKDGELTVSVSFDFPVCVERAFLNVKRYD